MNPKQFLTIGGTVLVLVGVLGFFLIGPTADASIFGDAWWFDNGENWAHLLLGVVGLIVAFSVKSESFQKTLVMILGIVGLLVGVYGFVSPNFLGANLENPADNILHIVVGAWALWAAMAKPKMMVTGSPMAK